MKAHLPETLKQQLQAFEREKREGGLSYASILEQRILSVDREMLDKLSASHDEAGLREVRVNLPFAICSYGLILLWKGGS